MQFKGPVTLAAAMLVASELAYAVDPSRSVVAVRYLVSEQLPDRVEETVTDPLERVLIALPRVAEVTSTTDHRSVNVEIQFEGGATEQDLATVSQRIEELVLDGEVRVTSRTAVLTSPRL